MKFVVSSLVLLLPMFAFSMEMMETPPSPTPPITLPSPKPLIPPEKLTPVYKLMYEGMAALETIAQIREKGYQKQLYHLALRVTEATSTTGKVSKTQRTYVSSWIKCSKEEDTQPTPPKTTYQCDVRGTTEYTTEVEQGIQFDDFSSSFIYIGLLKSGTKEVSRVEDRNRKKTFWLETKSPLKCIRTIHARSPGEWDSGYGYTLCFFSMPKGPRLE